MAYHLHYGNFKQWVSNPPFFHLKRHEYFSGYYKSADVRDTLKKKAKYRSPHIELNHITPYQQLHVLLKSFYVECLACNSLC